MKTTYLYYNDTEESLQPSTVWLGAVQIQIWNLASASKTWRDYRSTCALKIKHTVKVQIQNLLHVLLHMFFIFGWGKSKCPAQLTCSSSWCSLAWTLLDTPPYYQGWDPIDERPLPLLCNATQKEEFQNSRLSGIISWDLGCPHRTILA